MHSDPHRIIATPTKTAQVRPPAPLAPPPTFFTLGEWGRLIRPCHPPGVFMGRGQNPRRFPRLTKNRQSQPVAPALVLGRGDRSLTIVFQAAADVPIKHPILWNRNKDLQSF